MLSRFRYPILLLASVLMAGAATLIDNEQVRVVTATDQPHVRTKPHEHKVNRVMVYLQAGRQEIVSGGKTTIKQWKAGEAQWSPATATHTAEIVSGAPVTMIEIELKKPADPGKKASSALDPVKVAPQYYHVEFENPQVRVLRVRIPAKTKVPAHEHMLNRVAVYLTDQDFTVRPVGGAEEHQVHKVGDVSWGGPAHHAEENLSDKPFEVVVVELKD